VIRRRLTLGELQQLQFAPLGACNVTNTELLFEYHGTGTQADYSGNGSNGTVTSATVADHVGLGPSFGFDPGWIPYTVAAAGGGQSTPILSYHQRSVYG